MQFARTVANLKLFTFYGKYIQNRPSKKCLLPTPTGELCPVGLCLFYCTILPDAPICIGVGGLLVGPWM